MPDNKRLPPSKVKEVEAKTRRLLLSTIFVSAGFGGTFAVAAAFWINERSEALVLFILFLSVCWRRFKIEPPCRLNFEPGLLANR